jgi:hypothetical protein
MRLFLHKLLGKKAVKTTLLYSGHLHGWNVKDFHDRCDNKGATLNLFQIKDGDCVGGYTTQHWESSESLKYKADSSAFLFNLTCSLHFPSKASGNDIRCHRSIGPIFSGGSCIELGVSRQPFNDRSIWYSIMNDTGYKIPIVNGKNQLTNQMSCSFTISELEVWAVEEE